MAMMVLLMLLMMMILLVNRKYGAMSSQFLIKAINKPIQASSGARGTFAHRLILPTMKLKGSDKCSLSARAFMLFVFVCRALLVFQLPCHSQVSRNAGTGGEWFIGPKCRLRLHCTLTVHGSGNWTSTLWQDELHSPLLATTARLLRRTCSGKPMKVNSADTWTSTLRQNEHHPPQLSTHAQPPRRMRLQ